MEYWLAQHNTKEDRSDHLCTVGGYFLADWEWEHNLSMTNKI